VSTQDKQKMMLKLKYGDLADGLLDILCTTLYDIILIAKPDYISFTISDKTCSINYYLLNYTIFIYTHGTLSAFENTIYPASAVAFILDNT